MIRTKRNGLGLAGALGTLVTLGVAACGDDFNGDCKVNHTCPAAGGEPSEGGGSDAGPSGGGAEATGTGGMNDGEGGAGAVGGGGAAADPCTSSAECDNGNPADGAETCGDDGFCAPGDAPPYVVSVSPENEAEDIELDSTIVITFSEPIDPASVAGAIEVLDGDNVLLGGADVDGATVTFTPDVPFELWSSYDLEVSTAVKDTAGLNMLEAHSSTFVSRDGAWTLTPAVTGETVYDIAPTLPISESGQIYAGYLVDSPATEFGATPTVRRFKDAKGVGAALMIDESQETLRARGAIDFAVSTSGSVAFAWAAGSSQSYIRVHDELTGNWLPARQASGTSSVSDLQFFEVGWHVGGTVSVFSKQNFDSFKIFLSLVGQVPAAPATHEPGAASPFALAFDGEGNGFAVWSQVDSANRSQIAYSRYLANNESWAAPVMLPGSRASQAGAGHVRSAPTIVVRADGTAQVAWFSGAGAAATLNASEFSENAWSQPRLVSGTTQIEVGTAAPALVAVGDTFAAAWVAEGSASGVQAYTATFDTVAQQWNDAVEHVAEKSSTWEPARIAADARGNLMVVWTTDAGASQRQLVYRRYSGARDVWSDVREVPQALFPVATGIDGPVHLPLGMNAKGHAGLMWAVQDQGPHWNAVQVASFF